MFMLHGEHKDMVEHCDVKSEVENAVDFYIDDAQSYARRADTPKGGVSSMQLKIIKVETEEDVVDNFVSVKAEPWDSNVEQTGDFIAGDSVDLKLKTEEIDLGCDYIEYSQDSTSNIDDNQQTSMDIDSQNQESRTSKKVLICTVCNKQLKSSLKSHMLTHTGEKPYECSFCKRKFTQRAHLQLHILTHTGEKPHPCPLCEKRFTNKDSLRSHTLSHIKEKIYKCEICDRKFSNVRSLKRHMKVHSGEKNHTCTICNQKFVHKSSIQRHMKRHKAEN